MTSSFGEFLHLHEGVSNLIPKKGVLFTQSFLYELYPLTGPFIVISSPYQYIFLNSYDL